MPPRERFYCPRTARPAEKRQMHVLVEVFTQPFMLRSLVTLAILAAASGVIGIFLNFRELEFVSDGLVHSAFPGFAIGFFVAGQDGLLPGAAVAAGLAAVFFTLAERFGGSSADSSIAVGLIGLFSLGVVVVSLQKSATAQLEDLMFGRLLTVTEPQLWQIAAVSVVAIAIVFVTWRAQLYRSFDIRSFTAAGFSPYKTDLALNLAIALVVVAGGQALGVLLVLALLIVPMATARLVTVRLYLLVPVAIALPFAAGVVGLLLSYFWSVELNVQASPGAVVVLLLVCTYLGLAVWRFFSRGGVKS